MVMPQSISSKKKCLSFPPPELFPSWGSEEKINLPRHIRIVNETKIEGRERKCLFIILTIPSEPDLPWKLPHLKEIEIQWISENKHCLVLLPLFNCALD